LRWLLHYIKCTKTSLNTIQNNKNGWKLFIYLYYLRYYDV
jgi:hypothetical protein